jgi:glycosyltransferase involved in cell wall biosynthesis
MNENRRIKIGLDVRTLIFPDSAQRGIGQYTFHHLFHLIPLTPAWDYYLFVEDTKVENQYIDRLNTLENATLYSLNDQPQLPLDLFHSADPMGIMLGYDSPFRLFQGTPMTAVFYDLTPLVLAKEYLSRWPVEAQVAYRSRLTQLKNREVTLLCISDHTRQDLIRYTGINPTRAEVISGGLNQSVSSTTLDETEVANTLEKYKITRPFFLSVGGQESHKQFDMTLGAFVTLQSRFKCQLVVVGSLSDPWKVYYKKLAEEKGIPDVFFTGFISREELQHLYSRSLALIFPSKYEGFGLPVLEAMANRCPVIACRSSSIPEVAGDAALLFSPEKPHEIAGMMYTIANDGRLRNRLIEKGVSQAYKFTWEKVARKTVQVFEMILNRALGASNDGELDDQETRQACQWSPSPNQADQVFHHNLRIDPSGDLDQTPEICATIDRVNRYFSQGRPELAYKIAQKELSHLPKYKIILEEIEREAALKKS